MKFVKLLFIVLLMILLLAGCGKEQEPEDQIIDIDASEALTSGEPQELVVMSHDSFAVSESVIAAFEEANNATVSFVKSGDTGAALNRAILSKESPIADVFFGVDNTFLSRALDEEIFEPYDSPNLINIHEGIPLVEGFYVVPVDFGDVCINYDKNYFWTNPLFIPQTLEDFTKPEYAGLLVVENPATSSPGLAFMLATIAHFGEDGYLEYWAALRENGLVVVNDWETAYYSNFSRYAGPGGQPMVVSYSTSPAAEWLFSEKDIGESPTGSIFGPDTCYRQIEYAGILKGTQNRKLAEAFIDFLLDEEFQTDLLMQMFVYPVNQEVDLPGEFSDVSLTTEQPVILDPDYIAENRDRWIQEWDETVLR